MAEAAHGGTEVRIEIVRKDIPAAMEAAIVWCWSNDLETLAAIAEAHPDAEFFRADGKCGERITEFTAEEILICKREHIQIT